MMFMGERGGYKTRVEFIMRTRGKLEPRQEVDGEEHLEISGRLREGWG